MDSLPYTDREVDCVCYGISYDEIMPMIKEHNPKDTTDIMKCCRAGRACGMCVPYINYYIKEKQGEDKIS